MPRIPYLEMSDASPEYRDMLKGRHDLNLYRMLPHATTIAPGFLKMGGAILRACGASREQSERQGSERLDHGVSPQRLIDGTLSSPPSACFCRKTVSAVRASEPYSGTGQRCWR